MFKEPRENTDDHLSGIKEIKYEQNETIKKGQKLLQGAKQKFWR